MAQEIHLNDVGTVFELTATDGGVVVNLSTASVKQIIFAKPSGATLTQNASFVTDGTDGKVKYTTVAGDLDMLGNWQVQLYVELATGKWKSNIQRFRVYGNL